MAPNVRRRTITGRSMNYNEIRACAYRRDRYQTTHPVLLEIEVSGIRWQAFKRAIEDIDEARLIGSASNGRAMVAQVACLDHEVGDALADGWTT